MAGLTWTYEYRMERAKEGKKMKWYKFNLSTEGASQHVEKFLKDFVPSKLTRTAGICCVEIGFYGDEEYQESGSAGKEESQTNPEAEELAPEPGRPEEAGAACQKEPGGEGKNEPTPVVFVRYRETSRADGSPGKEGMQGSPWQQGAWVYDLIPKQKSQAKLLQRLEQEREIETMKEAGGDITKEVLHELGLKHDVRRGAWLFYVATGDRVDYMWRKLALALVEGKIQAKKIMVTSRHDVSNTQHQMMQAQCADFSNREDVFLLEKQMRAIGIRTPLYFKPVIYSRFGIYKENPWGIKSALYVSQFNVVSRTSSIITH